VCLWSTARCSKSGEDKSHVKKEKDMRQCWTVSANRASCANLVLIERASHHTGSPPQKSEGQMWNNQGEMGCDLLIPWWRTKGSAHNPRPEARFLSPKSSEQNIAETGGCQRANQHWRYIYSGEVSADSSSSLVSCFGAHCSRSQGVRGKP
jgi:hypothetical protein